MQEFEYKEQYKYLSAICLCITDACNLACKYCFVEQHPNFMSLQTAKDIADWLYNNCQIKIKNNWVNEKEKCKINFFGGEPMLLFDEVIKPLIEYCKEKNYEILNRTIMQIRIKKEEESRANFGATGNYNAMNNGMNGGINRM